MKLLIILLLVPLVSFSIGYHVMPITDFMDRLDEFKAYDDTGLPMGGEHTDMSPILNTNMDTGEMTHVTGETGGRRPLGDERVDIEVFFDKMETLKRVFEEIVRNEVPDDKIIGMWVFFDKIMKLKKEYEEGRLRDGMGRRPTVTDLEYFKDKIKDLKKIYINNKDPTITGWGRFDIQGFFDKMKDMKKVYDDKIRNDVAMGLHPVDAGKSLLLNFFDKMMELKSVYEATTGKDGTDRFF